jgi:hypothetical protein
MIHNHTTERPAASGWAKSGVVLVVIDAVWGRSTCRCPRLAGGGDK